MDIPIQPLPKEPKPSNTLQVWIFPKGTEMSRCEEEATGMFLLIQGKARSYPGAPALYSKLPNAWFDLEVMQCVAHCILHAEEIRDILLRCPFFTQRKYVTFRAGSSAPFPTP